MTEDFTDREIEGLRKASEHFANARRLNLAGTAMFGLTVVASLVGFAYQPAALAAWVTLVAGGALSLAAHRQSRKGSAAAREVGHEI